MFPFKKLCICGGCGGNVTAEIKYRRLKSNKVNTHIYYHCNRVKDYDCNEPYITEEELIKQLVVHLPKLKLDVRYLMSEFESEIKRFNHLKRIINREESVKFELTPHKKPDGVTGNYTSEEIIMVQEYLLHILQFGSPEERLKILGGIKSRFELQQRTLLLLS